MKKINFDFKSKEKPESLATTISSHLHSFSPEDVLSHRYDLTEYDSDLITKVLD